MANKFQELAMALSESNKVQTGLELSELKAQRDQINKMFDFKISEMELKQTEQKQAQEQVKAEEKQNKIKTDLIKSMLDSGEATGGDAGVFIGRDAAQGPQQFEPNPFPLLPENAPQ